MKNINVKVQKDRRGALVFMAYDERVVVGTGVVSQISNNCFIKNKSGEYALNSLEVDYKYIGEGIESILIKAIINDITIERDSVLAILKSNIEWMDDSFLERRGFEIEPIIYHQLVYVLGEDYLYNLENIEEDCVQFLDKDRLIKSE